MYIIIGQFRSFVGQKVDTYYENEIYLTFNSERYKRCSTKITKIVNYCGNMSHLTPNLTLNFTAIRDFVENGILSFMPNPERIVSAEIEKN